MNKLILGLIISLILSSCSSKFSFQKRRYNKGFYISQSSENRTKAAKDKSSNRNELAINSKAEKEGKPEITNKTKLAESNLNPTNDELIKDGFTEDKTIVTNQSEITKTTGLKKSKETNDSYLETKSDDDFEKSTNNPLNRKAVASKHVPLGGGDWGLFGIIGIGFSILVVLIYLFYLLFIVFSLVNDIAAALLIIGLIVAVIIVFGIIVLINSD